MILLYSFEAFPYGSGYPLYLFGINSKNRKASKLGLIQYALPEMKSWLMQKRDPSWYEGKKRLYIALTDNIDEVAILEIHNNELVNTKYLTIESANATI